MRQLIQDYLRFGRKDRIGGICLLIIMAAAVALPHLLAPKHEDLLVSTEIESAVTGLEQSRIKNGRGPVEPGFSIEYDKPVVRKGELFRFDPNTATPNDWLRMGLSEKTTGTIINYRNKGGKFYKPEDLQKIWGLPSGFYERVKDYIDIHTNRPVRTEFAEYTPKERKVLSIEINAADTNQLIALPGIGSRLSARIINFREKLGGFHSVEQIGETYGLPDSTFQKIRNFLTIDEEKIRKININAATKDELRAHPYIKWNLANAIVEYRNQHGSYKTLEDLKKVVSIDEQELHKVLPYLTF